MAEDDQFCLREGQPHDSHCVEDQGHWHCPGQATVVSSSLDVRAVIARYGDWYGEAPKEERVANWTLLDDGESMSHCIVREDLPDLLAHIRVLETKLDAAPHDKTCGSHPLNGVSDHGCTCWKAEL